MTNLLLYQNDITGNVESGMQIDCVYTDFSKVFDRVCHAVLIYKLSKMEFPSWLLTWLHSYISNRKQFVKIKNYISDHITSGVPQGSHLGPLLFNLFINDMGSTFKYSKYLLFADDLNIYKTVRSVEDCRKLQDDVNLLNNWCI